MRIAGWVLLVLTGCAVLGQLYGASFPGEPSGAFYVATLALVPLFALWCAVAIAQRRTAGRRGWVVLSASPILVLAGIVLICTSVPLQLHWLVVRPSFERALQEFGDDASVGANPHRVADYPIEQVNRRADNFVDFTYRNDENGWDGFSYSADGGAPQTVHQPAGDYVIASAKRLGPHWFAFQSYHTMR